MEINSGYRESELGAIPTDWCVAQVGETSTKVGSGITPTGGERVYKSEGRAFVRSQNVGWGELLLDDVAFIDDAIHSRFSDTEIMVDDVFLNITGASIGRSSVADTRVEGGNVNQHVCIIRADQRQLIPGFLNFVLLSSLGQRQIDSFQAGGNRQGLNFAQVRSIRFPLPSLTEQRAIAEALSDVDALLGALDRLIAKKRDLKQAAMQQLLTGQTRLPGFGGTWEVKRFGELVFPRRDRVDPRRSGVHEFCVEMEHIESASGRLLGSTSTSEQSSLKSVFRVGDVLFGKLRAYLRKYWLATRLGICSTEIWVFTPKDPSITTDYLFQVIRADEFIETASNAYGTHMPRSDWNIVKNYELKLPPIHEQSAIVAVLSDMDAELANLEQRRDKTRALKQGMMQELLTGKTRLV